MKKIKHPLPFYFLVFFLMAFSNVALSAPDGDPGGGGNPDGPITGIEYIIGLGGLYGVRKILRSSKKTK